MEVSEMGIIYRVVTASTQNKEDWNLIWSAALSASWRCEEQNHYGDSQQTKHIQWGLFIISLAVVVLFSAHIIVPWGKWMHLKIKIFCLVGVQKLTTYSRCSDKQGVTGLLLVLPLRLADESGNHLVLHCSYSKEHLVCGQDLYVKISDHPPSLLFLWMSWRSKRIKQDTSGEEGIS